MTPLGKSEDSIRADSVRRVVRNYLDRRHSGEVIRPGEVIADHPELEPELGGELRKLRLIDEARDSAERSSAGANPDSRSRRGEEPGSADIPADCIPGYEIIRRIRRGGQGVVYEAVQEATRRKMAIKIMRETSFSGPHDKLRFEREVQILGALNHPHIVAVHDSGTVSGNFFFVMDYIPGQPLDVCVAGEKRTIAELLTLFIKICEAVNAAHLRGVIHRDLKPSNIRVDEQGEPHILDFGLAKITSSGAIIDLSGPTMTQTGQFVGSLPWAAPEQVEGTPDRIDLRTDVYALGVILYQMLTGRFPYSVVGSMRDVMDSILRSQPVRPGTIRKEIDDEVDTMVLKCLSKERERRYQSAGDLGRDVERYLSGRAIEAKRDSTWYVLNKTVRRYKFQTVMASAFILMIVGFGIAMSVLYRRETESRETYSRLAASWEELIGFEPDSARNSSVLIDELLDRDAERLAGGLEDSPEAQVRFVETVAGRYAGLGNHDQAVRWGKRAAALHRGVLNSDHRTVSKCLANLARWLSVTGDHDLAERHCREAIRRLDLVSQGPDEQRIALILVSTKLSHDRGDDPAALSSARRALEMARSLHPGDHPRVMNTLGWVGVLLHEMSSFKEAEDRYLEAIGMQKRLPSAAARPRFYDSLGLLYKDMGQYEKAETILREVLETTRRASPDKPHALSFPTLALAMLHADAGDLEKGEAYARESLGLYQQSTGADHRYTAAPMTLLARILVAQSRYEDALPWAQKAHEIRQRRLPPKNWERAKTASVLGAALSGLGRFGEAEPLLLNSYPIIVQDRGPKHRRTYEALQRIINLYKAWNKPEKTTIYRAKLPEPYWIEEAPAPKKP